ncbi:MAG TPA: hypothetical protein VMS60_01485 [Solirubrobacterales bacterium]|nr:hypothetical protein [Solirubrobacterales bacterium]
MKHSKTAFLLLVLVAALVLAACGGGDDDTTAASGGDSTATAPAGDETTAPETNTADTTLEKVPTIVVRKGEPVGGIQELEFDSGEQIRFKVSSDAAEEIHVHGYDIAKEVPAGGSVEFDFPAEIEGIFEAELEGLGVQIAELRVNP